eukprot:1914124-Rhodomonas_salina.1
MSIPPIVPEHSPSPCLTFPHLLSSHRLRSDPKCTRATQISGQDYLHRQKHTYPLWYWHSLLLYAHHHRPRWYRRSAIVLFVRYEMSGSNGGCGTRCFSGGGGGSGRRRRMTMRTALCS